MCMLHAILLPPDALCYVWYHTCRFCACVQCLVSVLTAAVPFLVMGSMTTQSQATVNPGVRICRTNKHDVYMTKDGRSSLAGLNKAKSEYLRLLMNLSEFVRRLPYNIAAASCQNAVQCAAVETSWMHSMDMFNSVQIPNCKERCRSSHSTAHAW